MRFFHENALGNPDRAISFIRGNFDNDSANTSHIVDPRESGPSKSNTTNDVASILDLLVSLTPRISG